MDKFHIKKLLSNNSDTNNFAYNTINSNDYYFTFINKNDEVEKMNSNNNAVNRMPKSIKKISIIKKYYFYWIKIIVIILCLIIIFYRFIPKEILRPDLDNYLDKIYGEEDLLKIIKKDEKEMTDCSKKRRYEIIKEIENIYNVIEKIRNKKKEIIAKNKKIIRDDGKLILSCTFSLDNGYFYPTLVSITSLVINAGKNTFYNIYVLVSPDFTEKNKKILMEVEESYNEHCKIFIINMGNKYQGKDTNIRVTTPTYYRLCLQNLLPDVDRIVHLDGDSAVFQDLSDLIFLDMKGNYILGFVDSYIGGLKKYGIENTIYICAGVILIDLSALRKNNISDKYDEFLEKNLGKLEQHDQTTMNFVCQGKISTLPIKYGMWNFNSFEDFQNYFNQFTWLKYNKQELLLAYEHPGILHYAQGKPFQIKTNYYYFEWWNYANKTGYYEEIYKYSKF